MFLLPTGFLLSCAGEQKRPGNGLLTHTTKCNFQHAHGSTQCRIKLLCVLLSVPKLAEITPRAAHVCAPDPSPACRSCSDPLPAPWLSNQLIRHFGLRLPLQIDVNNLKNFPKAWSMKPLMWRASAWNRLILSCVSPQGWVYLCDIRLYWKCIIAPVILFIHHVTLHWNI